MMCVKEHIKHLMVRLKFPDDAQRELIAAFDRITTSKSCDVFADLLAQYDADADCDYKAMLEVATQLANTVEIHAYTVSLLLFLCMSKTLLERYRSEGVAEGIYYRSMEDLAYKLEECRLVYGVNGSFVASWFSGFFKMARFGLGRLQFEIKQTEEVFLLNGRVVPSGSKVINIHIPRTGTKLCHKEVLESYRLAAEHFSNVFPEEQILFICKSWLLDPWNLSVLKPGSNLREFCLDFEIVKTGEYEDYRELWRLFDCEYTGDAAKLPRDSSLRRAYADRVARGERIGWGIGMFSYQP